MSIPTIRTLSGILYRADLMNTSCVENHLYDEYINEAIAIRKIFEVYHQDIGLDLQNTITKNNVKNTIILVFDVMFWEGCLQKVAQEQWDKVLNEIQVF